MRPWTHRRAVADGIYSAERGTFHPQMRVDLNGLTMYLIGQKRADALRERIHGDAGRPQYEVARDGVSDRFPVLVLRGIHHGIWSDFSNPVK